jgi:DNA-binding CsgD family transcriptional regulator
MYIARVKSLWRAALTIGVSVFAASSCYLVANVLPPCDFNLASEGDRQMMVGVHPSACLMKTCYRCGGEFSTSAGRVCSRCRKPPVRVRKRPVNRNLTFREKQIAKLVCRAMLNKEIAFELHLTEGTIKEYLNRIFRKLAIKNRTELAIWAIRNLEPA